MLTKQWQSLTCVPAGKLSGQAAVTSRLKGLGYSLTKEQMADIFVRFKVSQKGVRQFMEICLHLQLQNLAAMSMSR